MNHFEYIRRHLSKRKPLPLDWAVQTQGSRLIYTASIPSLVACRIHIGEEQLAHGQTKGHVRRNSLAVQVAISKQITDDKYRVHMKLSRPRRGRVYLEATKLFPLNDETRPNIDYAIGQTHDELKEDFIANFPEIARHFRGLEASLHQPFFNLVELMKTEPKLYRHIFNKDTRNYYPSEQAKVDFLFLRGPLSFRYGYS